MVTFLQFHPSASYQNRGRGDRFVSVSNKDCSFKKIVTGVCVFTGSSGWSMSWVQKTYQTKESLLTGSSGNGKSLRSQPVWKGLPRSPYILCYCHRNSPLTTTLSSIVIEGHNLRISVTFCRTMMSRRIKSSCCLYWWLRWASTQWPTPSLRSALSPPPSIRRSTTSFTSSLALVGASAIYRSVSLSHTHCSQSLSLNVGFPSKRCPNADLVSLLFVVWMIISDMTVTS